MCTLIGGRALGCNISSMTELALDIAFIPCSFRADDGALIDVKLKTWSWEDGSRFWECVRIAQVVHPKRSKLDFCRLVSRDYGDFFGDFDSFDLSLSDDFKRSARSLARRAAAQESDEKVRSQACMSTKGMLGFLMYLSKGRRCVTERALAAGLLRGLLGSIFDIDSGIELLDDLAVIPWEIRQLCQQRSLNDRCEHLQLTFLSVGDFGEDAGKALADRFMLAFSARSQCGAIAAWLPIALGGLAQAVEARVQELDFPADVLKELVPLRGQKRLLNIDEDLQSAMRSAVRDGRAVHVSALARATQKVSPKTATVFAVRFLAESVCAARLALAEGDLSLASDASRVGNPAVDLLVLAAYSHNSDRGFALPPQDPCVSMGGRFGGSMPARSRRLRVVLLVSTKYPHSLHCVHFTYTIHILPTCFLHVPTFFLHLSYMIGLVENGKCSICASMSGFCAPGCPNTIRAARNKTTKMAPLLWSPGPSLRSYEIGEDRPGDREAPALTRRRTRCTCSSSSSSEAKTMRSRASGRTRRWPTLSG